MSHRSLVDLFYKRHMERYFKFQTLIIQNIKCREILMTLYF